MKLLPFLLGVVLIPCLVIGQTKMPKAYKNDFKYVPSGSFKLDSQSVSVQGFYMYKAEVSNKQYQLFLYELAKNGDEEKLKKAAIQPEAWVTAFSENSLKSMAELYHTHEAYEDYPVVNITWEGAMLYCEWLTEKINELLPEDEQINVRLPLREEFIRAGKGSTDHVYAWEGKHLTNEKGEQLCNYKRLPQHLATSDEDCNFQLATDNFNEGESNDLMSPVTSYFPSKTFGFYNLNGNVAEMTYKEGVAVGGSWNDYGYDVRLESVSHYSDAHPTVGFRPLFTYISPRIKHLIKEKD